MGEMLEDVTKEESRDRVWLKSAVAKQGSTPICESEMLTSVTRVTLGRCAESSAGKSTKHSATIRAETGALAIRLQFRGFVETLLIARDHLLSFFIYLGSVASES